MYKKCIKNLMINEKRNKNDYKKLAKSK